MNDNEARQAAWSKLCRPELIGNDGTKLHRIDNFDAGWNAAAEHYKGEMRDFERLKAWVNGLERAEWDEQSWSLHWHEDFSHENGQYMCRCVNCNASFFGHKRRVTCRRCHIKHIESANARLAAKLERAMREMEMPSIKDAKQWKREASGVFISPELEDHVAKLMSDYAMEVLARSGYFDGRDHKGE